MTLILEEIARDHGLDSRALVGKYILQGTQTSPVTRKTYKVPEPPEPKPSPRVPEPKPAQEPKPAPKGKKGGRKPKFSTPPPLDGTLTREFMDGLTIPLLKDACKMRKLPITGSKDKLIQRVLDHQENPQPPPGKKGKKKAAKVPEPEHNHPLDGHTHRDCEQCQTYGNPLDVESQNETFEIQEVQSAPSSPAPAQPRPAEEFTMDDDDIQEQLKAIVARMSDDEQEDQGQEQCLKEADNSDDEVYMESSDEEDQDPFDTMDYGDVLDEEE